ncbi:dihydroxy-acid dehydratase family protein [Brevibacterium sp. 50QC2O2]|uniref:IlvD/Edd family dehydratase n=1 Tax=unclassified Brevibacterium TaxID=2614124 RepID=UPI00211B9C69|nr:MULTISPECIES: IlvD/Edd family dehydratase [unclassified Brevibacterium]MCQ9368884.1 dihydroxy-acid dehydratase family protein [Brevibacterium sp. 91QC2O2]MCQ9388450.1 dihydroxy-acid dehydratase family protein [Brevibacterium sp. 50QC2O2]
MTSLSWKGDDFSMDTGDAQRRADAPTGTDERTGITEADLHRRNPKLPLRSQEWFDNPDDPNSTITSLERYLNYGLSADELQSGKPIIGIAQSGSDLAPCNRHHLDLAKRVREGIREAGGICFEFPVHPIQETGRRPTAALDRNLAYLGLVETLHGYPIDGVVLTTGCDKTTPSQLMAAATMNIPAIVLSGGPMLNGWHKGRRMGSGTILWEARAQYAAGQISKAEYQTMVTSSAPSIGHCNTMGTASTMNAVAEALGMSLPGCSAIPAPYQQRPTIAYETGKRIVEMVLADRKPSDIMTRDAFINAIRVTSAIGGSTNAPWHLIAIAKHLGVDLTLEDWQHYGRDIPCIVDMQPAGRFLGEEFFRAGGVPAVVNELMAAGLIHEDAPTVNGQSIGQNCRDAQVIDREVIRTVADPLVPAAGFQVMTGNLFDNAVMKLSVASEEFTQRYLRNPDDPDAFEGSAVVFDGPEDYEARIDDEDLNIDEHSILIMRGTGAIGYPGAAEVVNMHPPARLINAGINVLPCIGDGRQSGTSASPSILNCSPEAAAPGATLAVVRTGDRLRVDVGAGRVDLLVDAAELRERKVLLDAAGGYSYPASQTPWQEIQRSMVSQLGDGMVLEPAVKYQRLAQTGPVPRQNH